MQVVGLAAGWLIAVAGFALWSAAAAVVCVGVSLALFCLLVLDDGTPSRGGAR